MSKQSVGKSTVIISLSKGLSLIMNMLCVMVLSRIRTLEEYGTYSQILMSVSLVSTLFLLGLPGSINYFLARAEEREEKRNFLNQYYTLNLLLSLLVGVVLFFGIPALEWYYNNPAIGQYGFFLLLYPFASLTMSSIENVLVVYERTHILICYRFLNSLALLLAVLAADWIGLSFWQYMMLFLIVELIFALWVYLLIGKLAGGFALHLNFGYLRSILVFSLPLGLATAVGTLSKELDKMVISALFTTEEYAVFANAAKELPLTVLAASTTAVIMPKLAVLLKREKKEQAASLWKECMVLNFAILALPVFGLITYAPEAMTLLYSEKYLPGVLVFRIYAFLELLRCTYWGLFLNATGNTKAIFKNSVFCLGLNVVLNLLFYKIFGFCGPALATVVVSYYSASKLMRLTAKKMDFPMRTLIPFKSLAKIFLLNVAFAAVFAIIKEILPVEQFIGQTGEALLLGAVWTALYVATIFPFAKRKWKAINQSGSID